MQPRTRSSDFEPIGPAPSRPLPGMAKRIVGPMIAAIAIDLLDLATFGPVGLYIGLILGAAVGYWLAPLLGFPPHRRWLSALATGVYCTLPLTGLIPLATLASVISRAMTRGNLRIDADREPDPEGAIDVEYEIVSDQPNPHRLDRISNDGKHDR